MGGELPERIRELPTELALPGDDLQLLLAERPAFPLATGRARITM
jgi:hypothetical protein